MNTFSTYFRLYLRDVQFWLSACCALVLPVTFAHAQASFVTDPIGFVNLTIPAATDATTPSRIAICLPLHEPATNFAQITGQLTGQITGLTASTISNSSAGWTAGAFSNASAPYFVRITSGNAKGRTLLISAETPNTNVDLAVDNQGTDLTTLGIAVGASGDTYTIVAADTLLSLFGSSTQGGTSAATADNVLYWNGLAWQTFYYNTDNQRWQPKGGALNVNDFVLRPDAGLMFMRRATSALTIQLLGTVPATDLRYVVSNSGNTFIANGFPVDTTLSGLGFHSLPGWVSNADPNLADKVVYWNGLAWQRFYYTGTRWQPVGGALDASGFPIPTGTSIMITKVGNASGVSTLLHSMPYSLN